MSMPTAPRRGPRDDGRAGVRQVALGLLLGWAREPGRPADRALDAACRAQRQDAGLLRELVLGVMRHHLLYRALSAPWLRSEAPLILDLGLSLIAHQALGCDRIAPGIAVSASVDAVRALGGEGLARTANAVGRRIVGLRRAERDPTLPPPLDRIIAEALPADAAARAGLPSALARLLMPVAAGRDLADLNRVPALAVRLRPGAAAPAHPALLRQEGAWTWWSDPAAAIAAVVTPGLGTVQDPSQAEAVELLAPRAGECILDCCAAPGGKSIALAEAGARVIAADLSPARLQRLPPGLPRLAMDARRPALAPVFDAVLVDAPCSNTGVLARRPEARHRAAADLASVSALQREILAAAATLVAPGGRLVYATCSLLAEENDALVRSLPGWRVVAERRSWPDAWRAGAYAARLERAS